jgi:hypothetical protein
MASALVIGLKPVIVLPSLMSESTSASSRPDRSSRDLRLTTSPATLKSPAPNPSTPSWDGPPGGDAKERTRGDRALPGGDAGGQTDHSAKNSLQ